mmetsp:Transcript_37650/g.58776  ORF Transcript_37650/g.58776 Transcript_37650/m.58776 type:complete len:265 (-) Transcript_37650:115-909(-)
MKMAKKEQQLLGKPWLPPEIGMRVRLAPGVPKFLSSLSEKKFQNRLGTVTAVKCNPLRDQHPTSVWCDVQWDIPEGFIGGATKVSGYHTGRFGNFHLLLVDSKADVPRDAVSVPKVPGLENLGEKLSKLQAAEHEKRGNTAGSARSKQSWTEPTEEDWGPESLSSSTMTTPGRAYHDQQVLEWGLDPQGGEKVEDRRQKAKKFWHNRPRPEGGLAGRPERYNSSSRPSSSKGSSQASSTKGNSRPQSRGGFRKTSSGSLETIQD